MTGMRWLRRKLAPADSRRERVVRRFYVPLVLRMRARGRPLVQPVEAAAVSAILAPSPEPVEAAPPAPVPELVWLSGNLMDDPQAPARPAPVSRIVVLKLDHIGDFVLGLRAMRILREGFPAAHITMVCASWSVDWANRSGLFDHVLAFDFFPSLTREWGYTKDDVRQRQEAVAALLPDHYDLAVDLRYGEDTTPCLYRIDARYRAGFPAPLEAGLPHLDLIVPYSQAIGQGELRSRSLQAELRLQMLASTVVAAFAPAQPHPIRACFADAPRTPLAKPFALLSIGAGTAIRKWPLERYAEVGRALIERHDLDLVILGGKAEQHDAERLAAMLPAARVRLAIGMPLAELPQFVSLSALCVSNDTGMSHLTAALDVPTVVVLSGQDRMEVWRPVGRSAVAIGGWTPCQPCGLKTPADCQWGVPCLLAVTPGHVLEACERLLARERDAFAPVTPDLPARIPHDPSNIPA